MMDWRNLQTTGISVLADRETGKPPYNYCRVAHKTKDGKRWATHFMSLPENPGEEPRMWDGFYCDTEEEALNHLANVAQAFELDINWDEWMVPCGIRWVVSCECKHGTDAIVFEYKAAYDAYRKQQLVEYYIDSFDDGPAVKELLDADKLDEAWNMALDEPGEGKYFCNTTFGTHDVEEQAVSVDFRALPKWIQDAAKAHFQRITKRGLV